MFGFFKGAAQGFAELFGEVFRTDGEVGSQNTLLVGDDDCVGADGTDVDENVRCLGFGVVDVGCGKGVEVGGYVENGGGCM